MSRDFGMVSTSIWNSVRFTNLPDDRARLAYIYLHTNTHGNSIGAYRLPAQYMSADMGVSIEDAGRALDDLRGVGLIDYDDAAGVVRIRKWFTFNRITNVKHLQGAAKAWRGLPGMTAFLGSVAAEIVVSGHEQARSLAEAGQRRRADPQNRKYGERNIETAALIFEELTSLSNTAMERCKGGYIAALEALPIGLSIGLCKDLSIHRDRNDTETETDTGLSIAYDGGKEVADFVASANAKLKAGGK